MRTDRTDVDLLQEFAVERSDDAFRNIVERHSGMVYSAAVRAVSQPELAAEVTQAVFIILARKAPRLARGTVLAGWLYRTTGFVAREALRSERRRQRRSLEFAHMNVESNTDEARWWDQLTPVLENAMTRLGATDRNAIVLRFFEQRSFAEVADLLGMTEASAKMRVSRAVHKLRAALCRHGMAIPAATLLAVLTAHSASAAPANLSAMAATVALAPGRPASNALAILVKAALQAMAWNKLKPALAWAALFVALAGGIVLYRTSPPPPRLGPIAVGPSALKSLEPMAGRWEGTFGMRGDGLPEAEPRLVSLDVRTTEEGHLCEIQMNVFNADKRPVASYQFSHRLNPAGDRILTIDDPQIARMSGEGMIMATAVDAQTGEWHVDFRTPRPDGTGLSECRWVRKGNELTITREDQFNRPQGVRIVASDLRLFRRVAADPRPGQ